MRIDVEARLATQAHVAAMNAAIAEHEETAARGLDRIVRRYVRQGVARFTTGRAVTAAAGDFDAPSWRIPIPVDLLDEAAMEAELETRARAYSDDVARTTTHSIAGALGIEFNQSNALLQGVIAAQSGGRITTAPQDLVRVMMASLQDSYDKGHSIPKAARAMRDAGYAHSKSYAVRIARTELIGAVNAASLAQVQGATNLPYKVWIATGDNRTRPTHRAADSQVVPIDSTFVVGGARLEYPGDSSGPGEEVILCRCTLGYTDTLTAGGNMAVAVEETETEIAAGASWSGVIAQEGVDTGDGRRIAEGALNWRELPLTLMTQLSSAHGGLDSGPALVGGRIDSIERSGSDIVASGIFDTGESGAETERLVRDGHLRGISIDLAINDAEIIPPEDPKDEIEMLLGGTLNVLDGTILGATVVPFPAFENASIAIVAGAAMHLTAFHRDETGEYRASFYMPFAPFPTGDAEDDAPPAADNTDAADAIADITDAVNGHPGLDGKVVITIDGEDTTVNFPAAEADDSSDAESATIGPDVQAALARLVTAVGKARR